MAGVLLGADVIERFALVNPTGQWTEVEVDGRVRFVEVLGWSGKIPGARDTILVALAGSDGAPVVSDYQTLAWDAPAPFRITAARPARRSDPWYFYLGVTAGGFNVLAECRTSTRHP